MIKKSLRVLGVMTGTSCDGLDEACLKFSSRKWQPLWESSVPYPDELRKRVLDLQVPDAVFSSREWLELHRDLGLWYGESIKKMIRTFGQSFKTRPDVIANHGQTIAHFPGEKAGGMTLQVGDGTRIAVATGLTVVNGFRDGDIAAKGNGAPFAPLFHRYLIEKLSLPKEGIAIHNIGGISNLTYFGPDQKMIAFDTGPGNSWIDAAMELATHGKFRMDVNGEVASLGFVDEITVQKMLRHPFFSKKIPKATGRDEFPFEYLLSQTEAKKSTLVATATEITVESIARAYNDWILSKNLPLTHVLLCGGGAKNLTILKGLAGRLPSVKVRSLEEWGINPQFVEAQAFALFGYMTLLGNPLGGAWTGAKKFGPPGFIIPGENWNKVSEKLNGLRK